jgi:hypothetical protein
LIHTLQNTSYLKSFQYFYENKFRNVLIIFASVGKRRPAQQLDCQPLIAHQKVVSVSSGGIVDH